MWSTQSSPRKLEERQKLLYELQGEEHSNDELSSASNSSADRSEIEIPADENINNDDQNELPFLRKFAYEISSWN